MTLIALHVTTNQNATFSVPADRKASSWSRESWDIVEIQCPCKEHSTWQSDQWNTSWRKPESSHWLFTVFCWSAVCPFSLAPDWWKHWMIKWIKLYLLHNTLPLDSSKSLNQTTDFFIVPSPLSFAMLGMMCWPSQCHDDITLISVYLKVVSL